MLIECRISAIQLILKPMQIPENSQQPNHRLKQSEISACRKLTAHLQNNRCAICEIDLNSVVACLDHDHRSGRIRGVLCNNCNGIEGKIYNLSNRGKRTGTTESYLRKILCYWALHAEQPRNLFHPMHKFPDEKKAIRNAKARERRKKKE